MFHDLLKGPQCARERQQQPSSRLAAFYKKAIACGQFTARVPEAGPSLKQGARVLFASTVNEPFDIVVTCLAGATRRDSNLAADDRTVSGEIALLWARLLCWRSRGSGQPLHEESIDLVGNSRCVTIQQRKELQSCTMTSPRRLDQSPDRERNTFGPAWLTCRTCCWRQKLWAHAASNWAVVSRRDG